MNILQPTNKCWGLVVVFTGYSGFLTHQPVLIELEYGRKGDNNRISSTMYKSRFIYSTRVMIIEIPN